MRSAVRLGSVLAALAFQVVISISARAFEFFDGRLQVHGYYEGQFRGFADDFHPENAVFAQWANVFNVEIEADIAPEGFGPVDLLSAFARLQLRYDCIYNGCGVVPSWRYWGDRANRAPRNYTDGRTTDAFNGTMRVPGQKAEDIHKGHELVSFFGISPFNTLADLGATNLEATFAPIDDALFAIKDIDASIGNGTFPMGPWRPDTKIDPSGSLDEVDSTTSPLPLRPQMPPGRHGGLDPHGLFVPSQAYRDQFDEYDGIDQNYSQADLAFYHTQGQDERELKEFYVDLEAFDGRLWVRAGKQNIVWGKTELFRTTDQFNPQTLALSSLPSLEDSRIPLWSVRSTWSFYDVGPLQDVRLEVAANLDDFEPLDFGRCGMPYAVWLICGKTFGYWGHGLSGAGLTGEIHPDSPWESVKGFEIGARVEFRYDRFSFQISDFWGYDDAPTIDAYNEYERKVDPETGRPLDVNGKQLLGQDAHDVLRKHPGNRQLFDVVCSATKGIGQAAFGGDSAPQAIKDACLVDIVNSPFLLSDIPALGVPFPISIANALAIALTGNNVAQLTVFPALAPGVDFPELPQLNRDPADGGGGGFFGILGLSAVLTDEQEALLGCGPFYGTNCDDDGIDLFNAEASVLIQAFPEFEKNGPVATRYHKGKTVVLPGARGPGDKGYRVSRDGCVRPGPTGCNAGDPGRIGGNARTLRNPYTNEIFRNELGAASFNFMMLLAGLGLASETNPDEDCGLESEEAVFRCDLVRGVFAVAGSRRPERRAGGNGEYGRRDFIWNAGSELQLRYEKRNVLGFATDFAHDKTGTNWSMEATWFDGQAFGITTEERGWGRRDTYNLTVSVDRPTFIPLLNSNRTFLINSQFFFRYIAGYEDQDAMSVHGPFSALGTLTLVTGYHQDRLLPAVTWVHDVASKSGALITQITFRFNQDFSATFGVAGFYGDPDEIQIPLRQPLPGNIGGDFKTENRYDGLVAISERDEVFLVLRYTF